MSDIIGSLIGGALGLGNSIFGGLMEQQTKEQNMDLQKKTWKREDTAIQRRVKDMIAAGVNPVLAAGNPAQTSAPMRLDTPDFSNVVPGALKTAGMVQGLEQSKATIARTKASDTLIQKQIEKADLENEYLRESLPDRVDITGAKAQVASGTKDALIKIASQKLDLNELKKRLEEVKLKVSSDPYIGSYANAAADMAERLYQTLLHKGSPGVIGRDELERRKLEAQLAGIEATKKYLDDRRQNPEKYRSVINEINPGSVINPDTTIKFPWSK